MNAILEELAMHGSYAISGPVQSGVSSDVVEKCRTCA